MNRKSQSSPQNTIDSLFQKIAEFYYRLPSSGLSLFKFNMERQKKLFGFPEDLEERAIITAAIISLPVLIIALITGNLVLSVISISLAGLVAGTLLLIPGTMFSIKRATAVQDSLSFFIHFLTAVEHMNLERAYHESTQNLITSEFRRGWSKLVIHDTSNVPELLERLAQDIRIYSEHLYVAMRSLSSELRKPHPDLGKILEETTNSLRLASETSYEIYLSKMSLVSVIFAVVPFTIFLLFPIGISFTGGNTNEAFIGAGFISIAAVYLAFLYLTSYLPPNLNILEREPSREAMRKICMKKGGENHGRKFVYVFIVAAFLAAVHPLFTVIFGLGLMIYFSSRDCTVRYVNVLNKELREIPIFLRDLSFELLRYTPLEVALKKGNTAAHFRSALQRGTVIEEMPEKTFIIVQSTIDSLRHSGTALGKSLDTLRVYIGKNQDYQDIVSSKMEDARTNLSLVFWFLPLTVLMSIGVFKFITNMLTKMKGIGNSIFGFNISNAFLTANINIYLALGVAAIFLLLCFFLTAMLATLSEEVVYWRMIENKIARIGLGLVIFGLGGLALLWI